MTLDHSELIKWEAVQKSDDIFAVTEFLEKSANSPYKKDAEKLQQTLLQREIGKMHQLRNLYDLYMFERLIDSNIVNPHELVKEGLITEESYRRFRNPPALHDLQMQDSITEYANDHTDVFFLGMPLSGKSSLLMGLLNSPRLHYDYSVMGGEYAANLQEYTEAGCVPPSTWGTFTTAINARIIDNNRKKHSINLIEMSGQEFSFIMNDPEKIFSFEDMSYGATQILSNLNRKLVFVILDPTYKDTKINRLVDDQDEYGNKIQTRVEVVLSCQKQMIHKLFDLLWSHENKEIAKRIQSIHFIVTKADLLGNEYVRAEKAKEFVLSLLGDLLPEIKHFCRYYGINCRSNYSPKCYPFSLGTFYLGNIFDYDMKYANMLIDVIAENTPIDFEKNSWWRKMKSRLSVYLND